MCSIVPIRSRALACEGPLLEPALDSFVGCYDMPIRHGLTLGELATMANAERHWNADLHVVKMKNWQRGDWFDSTGLTWVDPSPNMRSLNAALLYPGVAMLEALKNYSVGRGTDAPFEQVGADWIKGPELAEVPEWPLYSGRTRLSDAIPPRRFQLCRTRGGGRPVRRHRPRIVRQRPLRS